MPPAAVKLTAPTAATSITTNTHNVLIIYSHQEPTSYNHALLKTSIHAVTKAGHSVKVSDLYQMNWNPVLEYDNTHDAENICVAGCTESSQLPADVQQEHEKIRWADLVIFQFPMHWNSFPAMMKGYVDRVFSPNVMFTFPNNVLDNGLMKSKRAMLSCTIGSALGWYTSSAPMGDIETTLWPIQNGLLRFCGFDVLYPEIKFAPILVSNEERVRMLTSWEKRLEKIFYEAPIDFPSLGDFYAPTGDPLIGLELRPEVREQHRWSGLNPGQHLHKSVPKSTMYRQLDHVMQAEKL